MVMNVLQGLAAIAIVGLVLSHATEFADVVTSLGSSYTTLVGGLQGPGQTGRR